MDRSERIQAIGDIIYNDPTLNSIRNEYELDWTNEHQVNTYAACWLIAYSKYLNIMYK